MHSPSHTPSCDSSTSPSPLPASLTSLVPSTTTGPNVNVRVNPDGSVKFTRKYEKTGRYSKKKQKSDSANSHTPDPSTVGSSPESTELQSAVSAATEAARRQLLQQQHEQQLLLHTHPRPAHALNTSINHLPPNTPAHVLANLATHPITTTPTSRLQHNLVHLPASNATPQTTHSSHPHPSISLPLPVPSNVTNHNTIGTMVATPQMETAATYSPQWKPQMQPVPRNTQPAQSSAFYPTQQKPMPSSPSKPISSEFTSTTLVPSTTYYNRTPTTMRSSQLKAPPETLSATHGSPSASHYQGQYPNPNQNPPRVLNATAEKQSNGPVQGQTAKVVRALSEEEMRHMKIKRRIQEQMAADHRAVLKPDWKTPFQSLDDAMKRLLPYHVFQYPDAEIGGSIRGHLSDDEAVLQSLHIFSRAKKLQDRYQRLMKEGDEKDVPSNLAHLCARLLRDDERLQLTATADRVTALKNVMSDLDKKSKEDRDRAERDRRAKDDAKLMSEEAERARRMQQLFRLQSQQQGVQQKQSTVPSSPLPGQNPQFQPSPTLFQQYAQARSQVLSMGARHTQPVVPTRNPHFVPSFQPSTSSQGQPSRYPNTNQNLLSATSQTRAYNFDMNPTNLNAVNVMNLYPKNTTNIPEPSVDALSPEQILLLLAQQHQEVYSDNGVRNFGHDPRGRVPDVEDG